MRIEETNQGVLLHKFSLSGAPRFGSSGLKGVVMRLLLRRDRL